MDNLVLLSIALSGDFAQISHICVIMSLVYYLFICVLALFSPFAASLYI